MKIISRHKWDIVGYVGSALPKLSTLQKEMLRKQLEERYCPTCGEYIYNPFRKRKIRHYHHLRRKHKFVPILQQRVHVHPRHQLVEWTRQFPHVMRLLISEKDLLFYRNVKPYFIHRIPVVRMWTIDEWNSLYPTIPIWKDDCVQRVQSIRHLDYLYTPDLMIV